MLSPLLSTLLCRCCCYCLWRFWCCYFSGVLAVAEVPPLARISVVAGVPAVIDTSALVDVPFTVKGTPAAADGLTVINGILVFVVVHAIAVAKCLRVFPGTSSQKCYF